MGEIVLLADSDSNSWEFSKKIEDYIKQQNGEDIPLIPVSIIKFRNGEFYPQPMDNLRGKDVYFIHDSTKNPSQWWVELLLIKDAVLRASAGKLTFVLPNMLYSRQDRKDVSRTPISARALADSISPGLARIITLDLHAEQIQGFYPPTCPVDNLYSFPTAVEYVKQNISYDLENLVIVSPDMGGIKRASNFAKRLGTDNIAMISKQRSKPGEVGKMNLMGGNINDKDVLIIDDVIDSGGTLCEASRLLKEKGAKKAYCYGTHGLFTEGTEKICNSFDRVMTSNTYPINHSGVEFVDVSSLFAEAIYRAHKGLSISELFR